MSEIDLSEIQNKDENDFIELNEEKTINKTEIKPKRKYKKREPKVKKTEKLSGEIETNNEIEFNNENKPEILSSKSESVDKPNEYFNQIFEQIKEDPVYKNQLIEKINKYKQVFSRFLTSINLNNLNEKTIDQVETI